MSDNVEQRFETDIHTSITSLHIFGDVAACRRVTCVMPLYTMLPHHLTYRTT